MLGEAKKRTMVIQKTSTTSGSNQSDAKKGILVKKKLSTPPGNMMVEGKKEVADNQKPSAPPGSMLGQGKKLNVVDRRPSPKVHSLEPSEIKKKKILLTPKSVHSMKLDSSSDKMPETEKKMKSSSKILGGVDAIGKKDSVGNYRKQIIAPKVSTEKTYKMPTLSSPPQSSSVKPLILRVISNKSLKLLASLKDQNKMRRDSANKLNPEMVPEKTLHKEEVVKPSDSALGKYTSSSKKLLHIAEAETIGKNQKKTLIKSKKGVSNDNNSSAVKLKFRRGKIVDLQQKTSSPRRLTFRWGLHVGESQDNSTRKRIFKKKGVDGDKSNTIPISGKTVLRHQHVQQKKDVQGLLNNVIKETTSKLFETRKSKVKALVGAFETVISLHNKPSAVIVS
ncbi:hypothetical protein CQW23_32727 [Capsicum baccatum]|uniref:Calmodulin-binding domain-containing protein n=1 Tax=Capsicum baccatum TaxID=33114 RepID=A0A2G2V3Z6_CAPBA|nr:hypothetical protein CQW23_32727 [Capsicum baccatum]